MLKSKHRFIQAGDLTYNDNGSGKFNKSDIRYIDERLMEWVSFVNDQVERIFSNKISNLVLVESVWKSWFFNYTQIEKLKFKKKYTSMKEFEDDKDKCHNDICICLGAEEDFETDDNKQCVFMSDESLSSVLSLCDNIPYLDGVNDYLSDSILSRLRYINNTLDSISVDEKVIIYGGGYQTEEFLRYANISRLDIINIVDIKEVYVFNKKSVYPEKELLDSADVIIVTPYFAAKQIRKYLDGLELKARIIMLSELCGGVVFTGHKNIWAPNGNNVNLPLCNKYKEFEERIPDIVKSVNAQSKCFVAGKINEPFEGAENEILNEYKNELYKKSSIILQGPIVREHNFTIDTIKLYNELFKGMTVILSTWKNEFDSDIEKKLSSLDVDVVMSEMPKVRGYQNINLQLITTNNGLRRARELGKRYAVKSRCDMRIYSAELFDLMYFYMKKIRFQQSDKQKERLVIFPPRYDYFFFIADFFMFGNIEDMLNYWNDDDLFSNRYIGEAAETMLGQRYAKYLGCDITNSLENIKEYKSIISKYFGVLDDRLLYSVWYKYFYYKPWDLEYQNNILNFTDWIEGQEFA